ncbi:MAG: AarF/UbiB family protein [Propionicimonas sp.]|uniref:ABC1 kinase family protein n=1 Tax=Propionicimonas sp. TaxID=1955623 RepID=UPI003D0BE278
MSDVTRVLLDNRARIREVYEVLARYGLGALADHAAAAAAGGDRTLLVERRLAASVDPVVAAMSPGERVGAALVALGPTFVKLGQMLSQRPDVVGSEIAQALEALQASVPADPPGSAEQRIADELGAPVTELFAEFEPVPIASASIGQVHRAMLVDSRRVVVKVMHSGAERNVIADLELMSALAAYAAGADPGLAAHHPVELIAQFATMMRDAIDLRVELASMQHFEAAFAGEDELTIPHPHPDLSSRGVLTMDLIEGYPVRDRGDLEAEGFDVDAVVGRVLDIYLTMLFRDGVFHADPHPGNFMLQRPDRIALLDYGDVGRLTSTRQTQLEEVMLALAVRDNRGFADLVLAMCQAPATIDRETFAGEIDLWLAKYVYVGMGEGDVRATINASSAILRKFGLQLPPDMALVFRVLVRLQGLAQSMGVRTTIDRALQPYLSRMVQHRLDPRRIAGELAGVMRSWHSLARSFPNDLSNVLRQLSRGEAAVDIRLHDPDRVADRVVDGLVAASALLAGAFLWSSGAKPTLKGLPLPGLIATGIGVGTWLGMISQRGEGRTKAASVPIAVTRAVRHARRKRPMDSPGAADSGRS